MFDFFYILIEMMANLITLLSWLLMVTKSLKEFKKNTTRCLKIIGPDYRKKKIQMYETMQC